MECFGPHMILTDGYLKTGGMVSRPSSAVSVGHVLDPPAYVALLTESRGQEERLSCGDHAGDILVLDIMLRPSDGGDETNRFLLRKGVIVTVCAAAACSPRTASRRPGSGASADRGLPPKYRHPKVGSSY